MARARTSLVLCALAGYLIARSGMRPIQQTAARRAHSAQRRWTNGSRHTSAAELAALRDIQQHADRSTVIPHISHFSDDVAHELRTPITNLRGEIEVALSKARSGEEYREILGSCLEECTAFEANKNTVFSPARTLLPMALQRREDWMSGWN